MSEHYDVIIIGTGAGGGTLLSRLAPTGKRILVLERGSYIARERENWDPEAIRTGHYRPQQLWHDAQDQTFRPFTHHCVGGNTKFYGGALLRLREDDFGEVRHHGGTSPAWPIRYADLERYYGQAEWLYHVHGTRGSDPYEPAASTAYRHPALAHEPRIAQLERDLRAEGLRPFPLPLAIRPSGASNPVKLTLFDGYPDPTESKADSHVIAVAPALAQPNVELRTGHFVERLVTNPSGRAVQRVVASHAGGTETFDADLVVVACGAIESAALMLRSATEQHPRGLANGSDLVGRNYMSHHNGALIAITREPNPSPFQKTLAMTDFYRHGPGSELPLGTVQLMGRSTPGDLVGLLSDQLPSLSPELAAANSIDFWLTAEDVPNADNRVTLSRDGAIKLSYRPTNLTAYELLERTLRDLLARVLGPELVFTGYRLDVSGVSHQCGTLRFGVDARNSVLDLDCRAHELDNLYVVDASFFPSSGAVNPSLTIMANALRVGDHLIERMNVRAAA
ncbi:MAG TPA: GMC family oxidoreductase [Polyangiales bacterium]|nr:GMC family oxidoreductase [Polyangiales bacterium]